MKIKKLGFALIVLSILSRSAVAAPIPGFEDPATLQRVMSGAVVKEIPAGPDDLLHITFRAYFAQTSPDAFVGVATNYERFPDFFPDFVEEGTTIAASQDHHQLSFLLHCAMKMGIFTQHVALEGTSVYTPPPDAVSEGTLAYTVTNYQDTVNNAGLSARLIPYQGGMLFYGDLSVTLLKGQAFMGTIQQKASQGVENLITGFREQLNANPSH